MKNFLKMTSIGLPPKNYKDYLESLSELGVKWGELANDLRKAETKEKVIDKLWLHYEMAINKGDEDKAMEILKMITQIASSL